MVLGGLGVGLVGVGLVSLRVGAIGGGFGEVLGSLPGAVGVLVFGVGEGEVSRLVFVLAEIRIPRLLLGAVVGAGLALCGGVMQGLFRNPMADPGLLGVSSGAALGAVGWIVLGGEVAEAWVGSAWVLPVMAFGGAVGCLVVVYRLSLVYGRTDIATMLLAGIAINAIIGALIGLLSYVADDNALRAMVFWSLGSLAVTDWGRLGVVLVVLVPALGVLLRYGNALNANLLGESEAEHLGIAMERVKRQLICLVALVVGVAVSVTGIIGFVGLVVPHLVRIVLGPDHRVLLPAAAIFGAILLVGADMVARSVAAPAEVPIGMITAMLGGPFFLWLLVRFHRGRFGGG